LKLFGRLEPIIGSEKIEFDYDYNSLSYIRCYGNNLSDEPILKFFNNVDNKKIN